MAAAGVPTARAFVCTTPDEAAAALDAFGAPYVVKDDGLAAGKGVVVTDRPRRGAGPRRGLRAGGGRGVPRRPRGLALRDLRRHHRPRAAAGAGLQAHPRRRPGPQHRRHGRLHAAALGARRPRRARCSRTVVQPTLDEMVRRGAPFVGTLYVGLALTAAARG